MCKSLKQIIKYLTSNELNYKTSLDRYIISKNPSCAADIEHLMKEYDRKFTYGERLL